jgi:acetoacetate decarboxylase
MTKRAVVSSMKKSNEGYSLPLGSPAYQPPPFFGGQGSNPSELIFIEFEGNEEAIRFELPEPLEYVSSSCVLWLGDPTLAPDNYGPYHEGAIILQAKYRGQVGITIPYIWTESDEAMLIGREIYGFPKMMCDPERIRIDAGTITSSIHRHREMLVKAGLTLEKRAEVSELPKIGPYLFLIRKFPSPDPKLPPIRQLIQIEQPFEVLESWSGRGYVEFGNSSQFRLKPFGPKSVGRSFFLKAKWVLPEARIIEG